MASTEPLSGVVVYDENDQALGGEQMGTLATQLGPLLNLRYSTTGARDAAFASWVAAGNSIPAGASVHVGTREYVYSGGWQPVPGFLGSGTAFPASPVVGDTFFHTTFKCEHVFVGGVTDGASWRQTMVAQVAGSSSMAAYIASVTGAGLAFHYDFLAYDVASRSLWAADSSTTLVRVAAPGFLKQATGADKPVGTTAVTVASVTVAVPDGLPSTRVIKVTGTVAVTCPTGVGAVIIVGGTTRPVNASIGGDLTAVFYDTDLSAGTRTYAVQIHSTVSGQNVNVWSPTIAVEIV